MVVFQGRSRRKVSGGLIKSKLRRKYKSNLGRKPSHTIVGIKTVEAVRARSAGIKIRLHKADVANVLDPKTKKFLKAKIITVKENGASRHFVRQNVMTKGAIIETDKGLAKVTSRPGQDGAINAVLV